MKKWFISIFTVLVLAGFALAAENDQKPASSPGSKNKANTNEVAVIKTTEGEMVLAFWPEAAPKTVANFKKLARQGFYDGTAFHRVIQGFMIQGGDPKTKDPATEAEAGSGGPGYTIPAEFNDHAHVRGVLSMARLPTGPDTAGSQFFICLAPAPHLDHQYTAFGKLIKGDDVLGKIGDTPVNGSKPIKRMGIVSIKIVPASSIK